MSILISYKMDFHAEKIASDRGRYIQIKGSIHQDTALLNASASNNKAARYEANDKTERKNRKIDNYTWMLHLFLNNWLNNYTENHQRQRRIQQHHQPTGVNQHYRKLLQTSAGYTFFSSDHGNIYQDRPYLGL